MYCLQNSELNTRNFKDPSSHERRQQDGPGGPWQPRHVAHQQMRNRKQTFNFIPEGESDPSKMIPSQKPHKQI